MLSLLTQLLLSLLSWVGFSMAGFLLRLFAVFSLSIELGCKSFTHSLIAENPALPGP